MTLWVCIYSSSGTFTPLAHYSSFFDCDSLPLTPCHFPAIALLIRTFTGRKTIPRVLLVFLILFLKHIQHLSGRCSCLSNLISIGLQVYGILGTMLLMQLGGPRHGDPYRWWRICLVTSDLHACCTRFILRSIDFIGDLRLRGALTCTTIAVYFSSCPSWCIVSLLVAATYTYDKTIQQAGCVAVSGILHIPLQLLLQLCQHPLLPAILNLLPDLIVDHCLPRHSCSRVFWETVSGTPH